MNDDFITYLQKCAEEKKKNDAEREAKLKAKPDYNNLPDQPILYKYNDHPYKDNS